MGWIAVSKLATGRVPLISRQLASTPFLASLTHYGLKSSGLSSIGTVIVQKVAFTGSKSGADLPHSSGLLSTIGVRHFGFAVSRSTAADAHVREQASTLPPPAVEERPETTSTGEQAASLSGFEIIDDEDGNTVSPTSASPGGKFALHPWAEWTAFINQLHIQGYFDPERTRDITALKLAFRHFGRFRDDIYSHLPRTELEVLAGTGCPSPERRVVSAAKRLRFDLGIKETPVCDNCIIRSKCIRAYLHADSKASASTAQVVRLLMTYGLNAWNDASSVPLKTKIAAETLLRELIRLSKNPRNPPPTDLMTKRHGVVNATRPPINVRPGDWVCQECNYLNFARNQKCRSCAAEAPPRTLDRRPAARHLSDEHAPARDGMHGVEGNRITLSDSDGDDSAVLSERMQPSSARTPIVLLPDDWMCPKCRYVNFARNQRCRRCEADAPPRSRVDSQPPPHGSSNDYQPPTRSMLREGDSDDSAVPGRRTQRELLPGDWICTKCSYHNFARNRTCRVCNAVGAAASDTSIDSYGESMLVRGSDEKPGGELSVGAQDSASTDEAFDDLIPFQDDLILFQDRELSSEEVAPEDRSSYSNGETTHDMQKHSVVDERSGDDSNELLTAGSSDGSHGSCEEGVRPDHDEFKPSWESVSEPRDLNDDDVDEDDSPAPETSPEEIARRDGRPDLYDDFTPEARKYWNAD